MALIFAGGALALIFLFLRKWIMEHRDSWWVRVLERKPMVSASPGKEKMNDVQCAWCGKPAE